MSRVFFSGFETNDFASSEWTGTVATVPTLVTTPTPHSGTYIMRTASTATTGEVFETVPQVTSGTFYTRVYVQVDNVTPAAITTFLRSRGQGGTVSAWTLRLNTNGQIRLVNSVTTTPAETTLLSLATGTWYRLEVRHLLDNAAGQLELRVFLGDSTTALDTVSITGEDTLPLNVDRFGLGKLDATSGIIFYYDDFAVNDSNGSTFNSWVGPGKTAMMVPDTDDTVAWTPLSGSNFSNVDDEIAPGPPDEDTTYTTASTTVSDLFGLNSLPAEVPSDATLIIAKTWGRARGVSTTPNFRMTFFDGTTTTNGTTYALTGSYAVQTATERAPTTDLAGKTKANAAGFKAGYDLLSALEARVTAVWVAVEWIESGEQAPTLMGAILL